MAPNLAVADLVLNRSLRGRIDDQYFQRRLARFQFKPLRLQILEERLVRRASRNRMTSGGRTTPAFRAVRISRTRYSSAVYSILRSYVPLMSVMSTTGRQTKRPNDSANCDMVSFLASKRLSASVK